MKLLVCLYTCLPDVKFLEMLKASSLLAELRDARGAEVLEVYASPGVDAPRIGDGKMVVPGEEAYRRLSFKTHAMIAAALKREFDVLIKIDSTVANYSARVGTNRQSAYLSADVLLERVRQPDFFDLPYNGWQMVRANAKGTAIWARKKGFEVDFERVFAAQPTSPPYFTGKFYSLRQAPWACRRVTAGMRPRSRRSA